MFHSLLDEAWGGQSLWIRAASEGQNAGLQLKVRCGIFRGGLSAEMENSIQQGFSGVVLEAHTLAHFNACFNTPTLTQ